MKKTLLITTLLFFSNNIFSQDLTFKNSDFFIAILEYDPRIDINEDKIIQKEEAENVIELNLFGKNLENVEDLKNFPNLKKLILTQNNLKNLVLNNYFLLEELYCAKNQLLTLEISNMPSLKQIACGRNKLQAVKLYNIDNLESLNLMDNLLTALNLRDFKRLKYLTVDGNNLSELDISQNVDLIQLVINNNHIQKIDITNNLNLKVSILYIDEFVKIIGTKTQLSEYKKAPTILAN